ncbi:MAG: glycosyltransferase family 4 protein [Patescibacteria group bacterium]|nr:glycosyltransferase family 4 protein [Patescibacteria group bacterium]
MRLVIATPLYPPEIGGPATYVRLLEEGLPKKGIEVTVVKFSDVRHLPKFIRHYAYYRHVLAAAYDADVVLALDPVSVGFPAMKAAQKAGKPFVVKIVGDYAWEQGQQRFGVTQSLDEFVKTENVSFFVRVFRRIQTRVARSATRVIVPSEYLKGIVESWRSPSQGFGGPSISQKKITVIYNAVTPEAIGTVPKMVQDLPRPLVVSVGRLVPWKGFDGLIRAVEAIGASLVIVGDGPEREALAKFLGNHMVLTGSLSHADTLAMMKSADVFALNSSYEGLSHVLVEALALGVPIVATDAGGNREIIEDGVSGTLVPVGDMDALVRALQSPKLSAHGAASRFTKERMLEATTTLLKTI